MLKSEYTVQDGKIKDASNSSDQGVLIPVSGEKPSSGELHYSNNVLKGGCLVIGDYQVTFNGNEASTVKGDCSDYEYNDSDIPTMAEMCPGCVFTVDKIDQGFNHGDVPTGTTIDYSAFNRRTFLGFILNSETNKIERDFACGIYHNSSANKEIPFCVESSFDSNIYQKNISIFTKIFGTGTFDNGYWSWSDNDPDWSWVTITDNGTIQLQYNYDTGFVQSSTYDGNTGIYTS